MHAPANGALIRRRTNCSMAPEVCEQGCCNLQGCCCVILLQENAAVYDLFPLI